MPARRFFCVVLLRQGSIVVFDAAYAPFIRTPGVPKSIFEIEGARSCCIEVRGEVFEAVRMMRQSLLAASRVTVFFSNRLQRAAFAASHGGTAGRRAGRYSRELCTLL